MEHLADELDGWWLIRVLFLEVHHQAEGSILKGRIGGTDDDGIPTQEERRTVSLQWGFSAMEYNQNAIVARRTMT